MPSLTRGNFKTAMHAVRLNRWRSLMTIMGIIIGIVSVVTVVSIGQGIKQQIGAADKSVSAGTVIVRPGKLAGRSTADGINFLPAYSTAGSLSADDIPTVAAASGVAKVVPLAVVDGAVSYDKHSFTGETVIGTTPELPAVIGQKVAYGDFFSGDDSNENGAIIGRSVARDIFGQDVPLGQGFSVLGQSFVVRGVFDDFKSPPLSLETDFNHAIFIPFQLAQDLTNKRTSMYEIRATVDAGRKPAEVAAAITSGLSLARGGQQDFTVLKPGESLGITSTVLNLLTRMIATIAAISLVVGGIGIMNVMLVSVTERLHEIGVRKAIGATSRQIFNQFLVEASVLSIMGGVLGIVISLIINLLLRIFTPLMPVVSWQVLLLAVAVSVAIGIIFGSVPALKAARKDPIEALRGE